MPRRARRPAGGTVIVAIDADGTVESTSTSSHEHDAGSGAAE